MHRIFLFILILASLSAKSQDKAVIPGEVIIQLKEGFNINHLKSQRSQIPFDSIRPLSNQLGIFWIKYNEALHTYEDVQSMLFSTSLVKYIEQNKKVELRNNTPNDKYFDKQWNLLKIGIENAWNVTTGGRTALGDEIVVAILDSGFKINMNDMIGNIMKNPEERIGDANNDGCPGVCGEDDDHDGLIDEDRNGRTPGHPLYDTRYKDDDDENGYIDDINGLNLRTYTDIHPELNHGTAVAGIIGAKGNNGFGITGINWDIKMLLFSDVFQVDKIIESYSYVYNKRKLYNDTNGEKGQFIVVTNFSSGIDDQFGTEFPIWCNMYDLLGQEGILSVGATTNRDVNVDETGDMPTTCSSPYLIAVTNTTENDVLANAGFGAQNIDLSAPGNQSISLGIGEIDDVGTFSGTSAAAPHVAGSIALLYSIPCENFIAFFKQNPSSVSNLKEYILQSVDKVPELNEKTVSGGRLQVYQTMLALQDFCPGESGDLDFKNIYPNPSYREDIHIEYISPNIPYQYDFLMFDIYGRFVMKQSFTPPLYGKKELIISPPELAAGSYLLVIKGENDIVARKHIIIPQ